MRAFRRRRPTQIVNISFPRRRESPIQSLPPPAYSLPPFLPQMGVVLQRLAVVRNPGTEAARTASQAPTRRGRRLCLCHSREGVNPVFNRRCRLLCRACHQEKYLTPSVLPRFVRQRVSRTMKIWLDISWCFRYIVFLWLRVTLTSMCESA